MRAIALEIERKFLCRLKGELPFGHRRLEQFYLFSGDRGEVRLRHVDGGRSYITFKSGVGRVRREYERAVPGWLYSVLSPLARGRVNKRRFRCDRWEIDLYDGLPGFAVMEVELYGVAEELPEFPPVVEVLREITEDERWKNRNIALRGFPDMTEGALKKEEDRT